jgi:hypothetical protein
MHNKKLVTIVVTKNGDLNLISKQLLKMVLVFLLLCLAD